MRSSNAVLFAALLSASCVYPAAARRSRATSASKAPSSNCGGGERGARFLGVARGDTTGARLSALLKSSKNRAALSLRRAASRPRNNSSSGGGRTPNLLSARASSNDQFLCASARPDSKACASLSRSGRAAWMSIATPWPSAMASATRTRAPGAMSCFAAQRSAEMRAMSSSLSSLSLLLLVVYAISWGCPCTGLWSEPLRGASSTVCRCSKECATDDTTPF